MSDGVKPAANASHLAHVRKVFEEFGQDDPMYAALSRSGCDRSRWDPAEFFATGQDEIREVLQYVDSLSVGLDRKRALDFGCGTGRLSQALADHFGEVVGLDIADSMIQHARNYNRHGDRVLYMVNAAPDLRTLESNSFDLVYTNKVLQHIAPQNQEGFMREFIRVLRPGGLAIFQTRNGPLVRAGTIRHWFYTLNRTHIRRLTQRIRGRPPYEMHFLARARIQEALTAAGGHIVDVVDLSKGKPNKSLRYCAIKS